MTKRRAKGLVKRHRIWLASQPAKRPRFTRWKTAEYEPGSAEYEALTNASAALFIAQALLSETNSPHAEKMHAARDWLRDVFGAWVDDKAIGG